MTMEFGFQKNIQELMETNGFFLEFKQTGTSANASGIGADTSGNDNHFAVGNLGANRCYNRYTYK